MITLLWNQHDCRFNVYFLEDKHEELVKKCAGHLIGDNHSIEVEESLYALANLLASRPCLDSPASFEAQGHIYISGLIPMLFPPSPLSQIGYLR